MEKMNGNGISQSQKQPMSCSEAIRMFTQEFGWTYVEQPPEQGPERVTIFFHSKHDQINVDAEDTDPKTEIMKKLQADIQALESDIQTLEAASCIVNSNDIRDELTKIRIRLKHLQDQANDPWYEAKIFLEEALKLSHSLRIRHVADYARYLENELAKKNVNPAE